MLLSERPPALQVLLPVLGPVLAGALGGWLLATTQPGYIVYTTVMILGGIGAGMEHATLRGGALRGLLGGALFAASILAVWTATGDRAQASLPHPAVLLIGVFAVISAALGVLGARLRRRYSPAT